jgi:branched-chain amino acid transport system substrate-binding protein
LSGSPGSEPGEPDKYYPTGDRTYTRIVPKDTIQAAALVTLMKSDGCTKVAMTNDKEVYGAGLARVIELSAKEQGVTITSNDAIDKNASNYRSLASKAKAAGADCFLYSGITANNAVQQYKDFASALGPDAKLFGPDGVAETGFVSEKDGGIPKSLDPRVTVTVATLSPDQYPPDGQQFFKSYTEKYGVNNPDPYAIYGYEAMKLALDAIARSKTGDKADIVKALFATKDRDSVLGKYSIDEHGDTTLTDYGAYKVENGELKFDQTIKAQAH